MKVYVASRFSPEGIAGVRAMYDLLRLAGQEITVDWTTESAEGKSGAELRSYLAKCARQDLDGVRDADALVFLDIQNTTMRGAYVEAGVALALGKKVVVMVRPGEPTTLGMPSSCIFFMLPEVIVVDSPLAVIEVLR